MPFMATRAFREQKTVELLGTLFGDAAFPSWRPWTARGARRCARPAHRAGADFVVLTGYEVPEWFAPKGVSHERPQGWLRDESFDAWAKEHVAVREAVGIMDMSFMATLKVRGRTRSTAQPCERERARRAGRQDHYTHWCTPRRDRTDLTVTRTAEDTFLVVGPDSSTGGCSGGSSVSAPRARS